jgi:hypothetical protein
MKPPPKTKSRPAEPPLTTELLILPDGGVLAHNLTPLFADLLKEFNPRDAQFARRARAAHQFSHR